MWDRSLIIYLFLLYRSRVVAVSAQKNHFVIYSLHSKPKVKEEIEVHGTVEAFDPIRGVSFPPNS